MSLLALTFNNFLKTTSAEIISVIYVKIADVLNTVLSMAVNNATSG